MIRAFIAVAVPESILGRCQEISDRLRELDLDGRFAKTQSMHLTLKFLGNIEEEKVPSIEEVLEGRGKETTPFSAEVRQVGVFPHLGNPRVVWVGLQPPDAVNELQKKIQEDLKPLGFATENREFHPHLTLLRLKSRRNLPRLIQYVHGEGAGEAAGTIRVEEIHLYQSILKPDGAEYRQLVTAKLGGP